MISRRSLIPVLLVLALTAAACSNSSSSSSDDTTTTVTNDVAATTLAPATTVAPAATVAPTTTAAAEPTTTVAATTTTEASGLDAEAAQALAQAKVDAAAETLPPDWTATPDLGPQEGDDTDFLFTPCLDEGDFDPADLGLVSLAVAEIDVSGPPLPPLNLSPEGSVEARVFETEEVAQVAFGVLEKVLGTEEGRDCFADSVNDLLAADIPAGTEVAVEAQDLTVEGADVATRIQFAVEEEGVLFTINFDYAATLTGNCSVFSSFLGFGDEFPPEIADMLMGAAVSV